LTSSANAEAGGFAANCLDLVGAFEPDAGTDAADRALPLSQCDNEIGTFEPGGAHVASSAAMTITPEVAANIMVAMLARDPLRAISTPIMRVRYSSNHLSPFASDR
jgi:hypothetical protein